jgi:hypothetical protein
MSNATRNLPPTTGLDGPFTFDLPVDGGSKVYRGILITQLTATGCIVPYSTASAGPCIGVCQTPDVDNSAGSDGDLRALVETKRLYAFDNGTSSDAFDDNDLIGSVVYGTDDHTVAKTSDTNARKAVGFFMGFEDDGRVRVFVDPIAAKLADVLNALRGLTDSPASADALRDNIVSILATALG